MRFGKYLLLSGLFLVISACGKTDSHISTSSQSNTTTTDFVESSETIARDLDNLKSYAPSGTFSLEKLGYQLPNLQTTVDLVNINEEISSQETVYSGLFKDSKMDYTDRIGVVRVPYHEFEAKENEVDDIFNTIIKEQYQNKIKPIRLQSGLILPSLDKWKEEKKGGVGILTSTDDVGITIRIKNKTGEKLTHQQAIDAIGNTYAEQYAILLENTDRQGFYLFSKLNKAAAIVLQSGYNDAEKLTRVTIYYYSESGAQVVIDVTGKDTKQVLAWYYVFNNINDWKAPDTFDNK